MAGGMDGGMRAGAPLGSQGLGNQVMGRSPMGGGAGVPLEYGAPGPMGGGYLVHARGCLLYTSPSPRDRQKSRMPSSA